MYDMLEAQDELLNNTFRPTRYQWKSWGSGTWGIIVPNQRYDVLWVWGVNFRLTIVDLKSEETVFYAQIPNWERAEIEDVVDALIEVIEAQS